MADGRHIENRHLATFQRYIVQLTRNLVRKVESRSDTGHVTKVANLINSIWRTAAILKLFYRYTSSADHPISMKFGVPMHIFVARIVM